MSHSEAEVNAPPSKKATTIYWLNTAIVLLFLFGFGFLTPFGSLETIGMQVLGIFMGLLYGWTFIGFVWPSIMGAVALGVTGYMPLGKVIMTGLGIILPAWFYFFLFLPLF